LPGLLFDTEDGGNIFLRNVITIFELHGVILLLNLVCRILKKRICIVGARFEVITAANNEFYSPLGSDAYIIDGFSRFLRNLAELLTDHTVSYLRLW
jgi:hypothetical protein